MIARAPDVERGPRWPRPEQERLTVGLDDVVLEAPLEEVERLVGERSAPRARRDALAEGGVSELVYWPMGPDLGRELRAMRDALEG